MQRLGYFPDTQEELDEFQEWLDDHGEDLLTADQSTATGREVKHGEMLKELPRPWWKFW
jgi:hypothetical protein